jgi:hypothetical protein
MSAHLINLQRLLRSMAFEVEGPTLNYPSQLERSARRMASSWPPSVQRAPRSMTAGCLRLLWSPATEVKKWLDGANRLAYGNAAFDADEVIARCW